jgi:hypothetical protein
VQDLGVLELGGRSSDLPEETFRAIAQLIQGAGL